MKRVFFSILAFLGLSFAVRANVTIVFSQPFSGGIASNFANQNGIVTDGMSYGIIVDTSRNGFFSGVYQPFTLSDGFLSSNGVVTDDYFALSPTNNITTNTSSFTEGDGTTAGGHGTINVASGVPYGNLGSSTLDSGDPFVIVWFSTSSASAGSSYGILSNSAFIVPSDGSTATYDSIFTGVDPVRSASFVITPEPTAVSFLFATGLIGSFRRRRR